MPKSPPRPTAKKKPTAKAKPAKEAKAKSPKVRKAANAAAPKVNFEKKPDPMERLKLFEKKSKEEKAIESQIGEVESRIVTLTNEIDAGKSEMKALRKQHVTLHNELRQVVRGEGNLFADVNEPKATTSATIGDTTFSTTANLPADDPKLLEQQEQDAFDAVKIEDLGVKGAALDKLQADGIKTGKDLRKWMQAHPRREIKGVGPAAVEKLGDQMATWFEKRRQAREKAKAAVITTPATASPSSPLNTLAETGMQLIQAERRRQIEVKGYTPEHSDRHIFGQLALCAIGYMGAAGENEPKPTYWPADACNWNPRDRRFNLARAGALFLAEKERLERLGNRPCVTSDVKGGAPYLNDGLHAADGAAIAGRLASQAAADLDALLSLYKLSDARPAGSTFAEDAIDPSTRETVANVDNHLTIDVARRTSGQWQSGYFLTIGKLERSQHLGTGSAFETRSFAIENAVVAIADHLAKSNGDIAGKKPLAAAANVRAVLADLQATL
jgi:hypothetical protein